MCKSLLPGPFFATVLLGSTAVLAGGSAAQKAALLPTVAAGNLLLTLAVAEPSGRYDAAGVTLAATSKGSDFVLSGEKLFVQDAHVADQLVVAARTSQGSSPQDGITLFLVDAKAPGVRISQLKTVDMTRRQCHVAFQDVAVAGSQVLGEVGKGWPIVQRGVDQAIAVVCEEMGGTDLKVVDLLLV